MEADELTRKILLDLSRGSMIGVCITAGISLAGLPLGEALTAVLNGTVFTATLTIAVAAFLLGIGRRFRFSVRDLRATLLTGGIFGALVSSPEEMLGSITLTLTLWFTLRFAAEIVPLLIRRVRDHRHA